MTASKYTEKLADEIIERLSSGEPLRVICRTEGFPTYRTVGNWRKEIEGFDARFLQARDEGFDAIAEDCLQIADDGQRDYLPGDEGGFVVNHDHIQRSKLRVETRLKLLAKWDPRRYGDRLQLANDPQDPITGLTDEQIDARIRALQGEGNA